MSRSLPSTALVVRFLTRRFIWEYDPTLGKTLPAFTALPLSAANAKKMTLVLPSATEKVIGGQSSLLLLTRG